MHYLVVWIRPKSKEYTSSFKAGLGCGRLNWLTILRITLTPTKSKAETVVALETDLMITTSMCVLLLEKHLKPDKAEIVVNIPSLYNLREE